MPGGEVGKGMGWLRQGRLETHRATSADTAGASCTCLPMRHSPPLPGRVCSREGRPACFSALSLDLENVIAPITPL